MILHQDGQSIELPPGFLDEDRTDPTFSTEEDVKEDTRDCYDYIYKGEMDLCMNGVSIIQEIPV